MENTLQVTAIYDMVIKNGEKTYMKFLLGL
jgi:hypothetical protein